MRKFILILVAVWGLTANAAVVDTNAHFPGGITLSGTTNLLTDNGSNLLRNGSTISGSGGGVAGTVVTNGGTINAGDIMAFGSLKTNATPATSAQITNAIGFRAVNSAGDTMGTLSVQGLTNTALTASRVVFADASKALASVAAGASGVVVGNGTTVATNGLLGQIGGLNTNNTTLVLTNYFQTIRRMVVTGDLELPTNSVAQFPWPMPLTPNVVPPSGTAAYIDTSAADTKLVFSNTWTATWQDVIPGNYNGGLTLHLFANMETATNNNVVVQAEVWALAAGASASMGSQSFDTANIVTNTPPTTARWPFAMTIPLANSDNLAADGWFQLRVTCNSASNLLNVAKAYLSYDVK